MPFHMMDFAVFFFCHNSRTEFQRLNSAIQFSILWHTYYSWEAKGDELSNVVEKILVRIVGRWIMKCAIFCVTDVFRISSNILEDHIRF